VGKLQLIVPLKKKELCSVWGERETGAPAERGGGRGKGPEPPDIWE